MGRAICHLFTAPWALRRPLRSQRGIDVINEPCLSDNGWFWGQMGSLKFLDAQLKFA